MGAIHYYEKERVFKLDTPHTSYLIGIVDEEKFLGHIYYGAKITDYDVRALMRTGEAPFVPSQNNRDRSSFLDAFPMEYPGHGVGDYRESAISVADKNGNTAVQPLYREHKIYAGKPGLPGLPATFGSEEECETLEIVLADEVLDLTVTLYYTAFYDVDVITRSVRVTNHAKEPVYLTKVFSAALDLDAEDYRMLTLHGSWASSWRWCPQTPDRSRGACTDSILCIPAISWRRWRRTSLIPCAWCWEFIRRILGGN